MQRGFTFVELLVVVTIIVILISLLSPAIDRAIYQAELAVCGVDMRGIGAAVTTYASDFRRNYPRRAHVQDTDEGRPSLLTVGTPNFVDDRPALTAYVSLKLMLDPLAGQVDLVNTLNTSWVYSTRQLW